MSKDIQQFAVRNSYGDVWPTTDEAEARAQAAADPEELTVVSRLYTPWEPAPPLTDRKLVQVNHIASLDLLQLPNGILPATIRNLRRKILQHAEEQNLILDSDSLDLLLTVQGYATVAQDSLREQIRKSAATLDGLPPEIVADLTYRTSHGEGT